MRGYFMEEEIEMVLGDPEGGQGVCWRASKIDEREKGAREVWVPLGYGDERIRFRGHF
jgi:hypothetical protein